MKIKAVLLEPVQDNIVAHKKVEIELSSEQIIEIAQAINEEMKKGTAPSYKEINNG